MNQGKCHDQRSPFNSLTSGFTRPETSASFVSCYLPTIIDTSCLAATVALAQWTMHVLEMKPLYADSERCRRWRPGCE